MELPAQFPYNPKWSTILVGATFFGLSAAFFAHQAATNAAGLAISGIIQLAPGGATAFYWGLAVASGLFVVGSMLIMTRLAVTDRALVLTTDTLVLPHGFLQMKTASILYSEIDAVWEGSVKSQRFLYLAAYGRKFQITASLLPSSETYAAIKDFLSSQLQRNRSIP